MPPPVPSPTLDDEEARRRIQEDLSANLVVEAAAGTGKTTMLVARIIAVLRAGLADLDRIIAVTFTEKAAGEMKLRLRAGLEKAREDASATRDERAHLERALGHLEVARIGTIHSLCADLLRELPVEAKVDPLFDVMPEDEAERLFEQVFDAWFQRVLHEPPEGVRRMLRRRSRGRGRKGPRESLRDAAWKLAAHRDFTRPWRRDDFDRKAAIDAVVVELESFAAMTAKLDETGDGYLVKALGPMRRFVDELGRRERVRRRDHDGLEAELLELGRKREWGWKLGGGGRGPRAELQARREAVKAKLDDLVARSGADLAACLHDELRPVVAQYDARKLRAGRLDFLDLLLRARDLVRHGLAVRAELQARFSRIFVDEFQDTDPLQAEILLLLAADDPACGAYLDARPAPGKLFVVGDPKQSIYRFRRADVALYETVKARLVERGASLLYLAKSYRSAPAIQDHVNAAFAPMMTGGGEGEQARYVALQRHRPAIEGQPAIVALPIPRPYSEWGKITDQAIRGSLPDAVGAFVEWLIRESGWKVTERDAPDEEVPIGARHICLLFKRFQSFGDDVTRAYVRALEARRVPHVLVGGRSFYDREEVQAVKNALVAIEWPDDELAVYATLRGPFFALSDDAILAYRDASGGGERLGALNPVFALEVPADDDGAVASVAEALAILKRLHRGRNRRPIADTIEQLLGATRAHAGIAIWPTGEQALANVLRVMDLARRFEAQGATSFRAFVDRLDSDAESGTAGEAPVVEEGTEGVRIMTVHRAKGLEFPVVILADPTAPIAHTEPSRHVDPDGSLWAEPLAGCTPIELSEHREEVLRRDREEGVRLAYVAATRARDLLVIPAVGDEGFGPPATDGWVRVLDEGVFPEPRDRRSPEAAPGCPAFGDDTVLERSPRVERDAEGAVAPGQHQPRGGGPKVVWWDPAALGLGKEPEGGLRQQRILAADASQVVSEEGELAHRAWAEARAFLLARGAEKTLPVRSVSEIVETIAEPAPEAWRAREAEGPSELVVELLDTGVSRVGRPHGRRFGTLVHAVLAGVALDADEASIALVARAEGRLAGASLEEIDAAARAALAALAHPLMRRAAESGRRGECRRESPVILPGRGGELIEGVVDLAFREEGAGGAEWVVVDFKTDTEIAGRKARYETQVLLYVEAIRAATGERARGVLLSV